MTDPTLLIQSLARQVADIPGVAAVALGGSRAKGTATPTSDIDLGIYYDPAQRLDIPRLAALAARVDDQHRPDLVTPIGGWGPWINGGGWLVVEGYHVDFLYRDLGKVSQVIDECLSGRVSVDYQAGHPAGFCSAIYAGETALCLPLIDPENRLVALKARVLPYPSALRQALIQTFFWEANFSLSIAGKGAERMDVNYVAGCLYRATTCLLQTLFAVNGVYWLNEKGAAAIAEGFALKPTDLTQRINSAFELVGPDSEKLKAAIEIMAGLERDVQKIVG